MMNTRILLDTDIGTDIDDAVCLAYLLAQPKCDLLGITTVTTDPKRRAMMASAMCKLAGRDIPIRVGCGRQILDGPDMPPPHQADALVRWEHEAEFTDEHAVEFLRRTIRANPGEITLLAIGPLTNIGLLFALDPEIPSLLRELVLMAGVFTNRTPGVGPREWNALSDPFATAIVYRAQPPRFRSVGLDVTMRVRMPVDEVRSRFSAKLLAPVLDFAEVWFRNAEAIVFHDPLAAAIIFEDDICTFGRGTVDVELKSDRLAGMTLWTPGNESSSHEVALDVNPDRFFEHYFGVLNRT